MAKTIGVVVSDRVIAGLIVDHRLQGPLYVYPEGDDNESALIEQHTESLIASICEQVKRAQDGHQDILAVGVAVPGMVRNGVIEDSPNLPQLKGARIAELLARQLREHGLVAHVHVLNDADGVAAGLAAAQGKLDHFIRVWTLGTGIGYGRYPFAPGVWEGGHAVVSLDDKERFCGCGGRGHIEGIMGHRAMRLRFLDMEPEEVFATARKGGSSGNHQNSGIRQAFSGKHDQEEIVRCRDFVRLWHKALAAGISTCIHQDGPGKFLITGYNARFVDLGLLKDYVQQMVKMSPLQGYTVELVEDNTEARIVGSGVAAEQAANAT